MQIDWITVAAQIVNFLVLVWVLQHFLYGPITRAMQRREQRIADRLAEAREREEQAEEQQREYREKKRELDERRDRLVAEAREAAEEKRQSLVEEARREVDERRRQWRTSLQEHQDSFLRELARDAGERFCTMGRRALSDLANAELEGQLAAVLVERMQQLPDKDRERLVEACAQSGHHVTVRTRHEPSAADKRRLTRAVHEHLCAEAEIDYEQDDGILCGIVLKAGRQSLSWTVDDYLDDLQQELGATLRRESGAAGKDEDRESRGERRSGNAEREKREERQEREERNQGTGKSHSTGGEPGPRLAEQ